MPLRLQPAAVLGVVVDLAVEDDPERLVPHRLIAARCGIDHGKSPRPEPDRPVGDGVVSIGAAVGERVRHSLDRSGLGRRPAEAQSAADSTHGATAPLLVRRR